MLANAASPLRCRTSHRRRRPPAPAAAVHSPQARSAAEPRRTPPLLGDRALPGGQGAACLETAPPLLAGQKRRDSVAKGEGKQFRGHPVWETKPQAL